MKISKTNSKHFFEEKPEIDPICPYCNKRPLKFIKYMKIKKLYVYHSNCGYKECTDKQRKVSTQNTLEKLYGPGITSNWQSPKTKETTRNTKLERYGDPFWSNPEKTKKTFENMSGERKNEIRIKIENTNIEKYGVSNIMHLDTYRKALSEKQKNNYKERKKEIISKREETNLKKYGYKSASSRPEHKAYISKLSKTKEYQNKRKQTNLAKFGCENPMQNKDVKRKWTESIIEGLVSGRTSTATSKEEIELYNSLKLLYPDIEHFHTDNLYPWNCDMYIPSKKLYIEYQGSQFHNGKPFDENNPEHIKELKLLRKAAAIRANNKERKGYNRYNMTIFVWCENDVYKRTWAKEYNLNFLEIWPKYDIDAVIKQINNFRNL